MMALRSNAKRSRAALLHATHRTQQVYWPKRAGIAIGLASVELAPNGSAHFCLHSLEILSLEGWGDETLRPSCPPSKEENEQH